MPHTSGGLDLKVGHAGMDLASADIGVASANLHGLRTHLNAELDRLRPQWTGAAQDAYLPARAQWDSAVDEMIRLLRDVGTLTSDINQRFIEIDKKNAARFA